MLVFQVQEIKKYTFILLHNLDYGVNDRYNNSWKIVFYFTQAQYGLVFDFQVV